MKLREFQSETDSWIRTLHVLQAENVNLKHRLAEVVRNGISQELLQNLEYYQNFFLEEDHVLLLFYNDIKKQGSMLRHKSLEEKSIENGIVKKQKQLRQELAKVEMMFYKKKSGFYELITAHTNKASKGF